VIKEIRVHASDNQRRQLYKVMNEKPTNIVYLTDLVLSTLSVHTVYEPLKTSMHHIQATSRRDITEIELAIFGKEARALLCTSTASWRNSRITLLRTLIENHPSRNVTPFGRAFCSPYSFSLVNEVHLLNLKCQVRFPVYIIEHSISIGFNTIRTKCICSAS
jgi:hypothetical protein